MGFIEYLEANWAAILSVLGGMLILMLLAALAAWRMCKSTYTALLDGAEARTMLAEERVIVAEEKAMIADERAMMLRDRLESLQPDVFDAKIDDIITRIREVEFSRVNGIIAQLNDAKVGPVQLDDRPVEDDRLQEDSLPDNGVRETSVESDPGSVHEDIVESHVQKIQELEQEARKQEAADAVRKAIRQEVEDES